MKNIIEFYNKIRNLEKKKKELLIGGLLLFVWIIVVIIFWPNIMEYIEGDKIKDKVAAKSDTRIGIPGEKGILKAGDSITVYVARSESSLDELFSVINSNDNIGLSKLLLSGQIMTVKRGTKVLIIDYTFTTLKVRILEGKYYGVAGHVPRGFVHSGKKE